MEKDNKKINKPTKGKSHARGRDNVHGGEKKVISEVKASARFIKISPRKVRLVINQIRGLEIQPVLDYLKFAGKASARPVAKLLNSAIANAENNFKLDKEDLYIKSIVANDGPILKRWKPRAHGRSAPIRKRTSHINLILGVKKGAEKKLTAKKEKSFEVKKPDVKVVRPDEIKKEGPKKLGKGPSQKGDKSSKGFLREIFQRKTG